MNSEHPLPNTRERDIFLGALDQLSAEDRATYLERSCGDNQALRASVEALLKNYKDDDFLETIALQMRPYGQSAESPGDMIGRYKLLERIGEGGCGIVWLAEQASPIRQVALKIIKVDIGTKEVIARFEAERQILALMSHSSIVKIFDAAATKTGRPYFVMELIRGKKITDYCDEQKLPICQRLGLFVEVCHAIQHAHQNGIIHRDIKPSNILVIEQDGKPVPKLIDFGIAKAITDQPLIDEILFTTRQQFIGTPAYMSPEQTRLSGTEIDARTDIYSLGVLLYELLVGYLPFAADEFPQNAIDEILHAIREQEPPRPSIRLKNLGVKELVKIAQCRQTEPHRLLQSLRGNLDCIVMKCLEKDRAHRYEKANDLAAEIQRHLKREPIMARPPNILYRFRKMVQRNKLPFFAAVVVVFVLAFITFWIAVSVQAAKKKTPRPVEPARISTNNPIPLPIVSQPQLSTTIAGGLIAYYPFNGNANDASGNRLNGTLWNSPTFVDGPVSGTKAIHLVGQGEFGTSGQYVTIPSIDLSSYSAFTISLWADIQGETADAGEYLIGFGQGHSDGSYTAGIEYYSQGNSFGFLAGNAVVGSTTSYLNQWHRYSMVYANGVLTAYLDGQVLGTQNGSMVSSMGNAGMGIHWWSFSPGVSTRFIGSLADVRIYNRALSSSEVEQLAQTGVGSTSVAEATTSQPVSNPMVKGNPQINSIEFRENAGSYTLTISGSGFGILSKQALPFRGDSSFFRIAVAAQIGFGEWGFSGDAKGFIYESWSDTQIQIAGLIAQPGDAVQLALWNPVSGKGATWGGNVSGGTGTPRITSVIFSGNGETLQTIVRGIGFGSAPVPMPYSGDLNQFSFGNFRTHCGSNSSLFEAGAGRWGHGSPNSLSLNYQSWSDNEIVINGFAGSYGQDCNTIQNGDPVIITVWNSSDSGQTGPQTAWGGFVH